MQQIAAPSTKRSFRQRQIDPANKIVRRAKNYIRSFDKSVQSSDSSVKKNLINTAERYQKEVQTAVEEAIKQNNLYKRLEEQDQLRRDNIRSNIQVRLNKNNQNKKVVTQGRVKSLKQTNDLVTKTFNHHKSEEKKFEKKFEAEHRLMTQNMLTFHDNEQKKLKSYWQKIQKLKTCQPNAKLLIEQREAKSKLFALKTEQEVQEIMSTHNQKRAASSSEQLQWSQKRNQIYDNTLRKSYHINSFNHNKFLEKYCVQLELVQKAFDKRKQDNSKRSERIRNFMKQTYTKIKGKKKEINALKQIVPEKCQNKMNKSAQNSFRVTRSTFHETCNSWATKNSFMKGCLKDRQRQREDEILTKHQCIRRKLTEECKLNTTMDDFRRNASFIAKQML